MRIYFVDELNKPIKCYSELICNDVDYTSYEQFTDYIDVVTNPNGRYNIKTVVLYSDIELSTLLPYAIPLYINSLTTKQSITINCVSIHTNSIDIKTLFDNGKFRLGHFLTNLVIFTDKDNNAVSDYLPVSFSDFIISATAIPYQNRHRILCYDENFKFVYGGLLTQQSVKEWTFNNASSKNVYVTKTQIQDPTIKYVRIQIPLASNSLTLENLPTDEFLNELGVKGNVDKFNSVQNSIAFINRLKSAHNRKRG